MDNLNHPKGGLKNDAHSRNLSEPTGLDLLKRHDGPVLVVITVLDYVSPRSAGSRVGFDIAFNVDWVTAAKHSATAVALRISSGENAIGSRCLPAPQHPGARNTPRR